MNNWVFSSGLANPINIDKNDRRFSPLTSVALQANMSNTERLTILVAKINRKRRHIYIEPGMGATWHVCVDWEHETFLDNIIDSVPSQSVSGTQGQTGTVL